MLLSILRRAVRRLKPEGSGHRLITGWPHHGVRFESAGLRAQKKPPFGGFLLSLYLTSISNLPRVSTLSSSLSSSSSCLALTSVFTSVLPLDLEESLSSLPLTSIFSSTLAITISLAS